MEAEIQDLCPELSLNSIEAIYEKYGLPDHVRRHISAVSTGVARVIRLLFSRGVAVDSCKLLAAALLHDIGRVQTHGIDHGLIGAIMVYAEGYGDEVSRMVERHIGAGLTAHEARSLGLPDRDFVPSTLEEKILAAVDNLAMGDYLASREEFLAFVSRKFDDSEVAQRFIKLHEEISHLLGVDLSLVVRGENTNR